MQPPYTTNLLGTGAGAIIRGAFAVALVSGLVAACGGPPAGYPDSSGVVTAQEAWCKSLAKAQGAGDTWEHMSSCKSFYPTASAAFLKGMAKCYTGRIEAAGDSPLDNGQLNTECTDEVVVKMSVDEDAGAEVVNGRCSWVERCLKETVADCKAAVAKLEASQRVLITNRFNRAALHKVASCLEGASCSTESEEAAFAECYKSVEEDLLWFPR